MLRPYQICNQCVMDTSDPDIRFDSEGRCNHCTGALHRMKRQILPPNERVEALERLVKRIKEDGKNNKNYDCIIGISGGADSSFVAYHVKKLGLRPLAVHFDNGWNSELAVDNIYRVLKRLDIDLYTHIVDWEEFRDLQLSFLRASVANAEGPTDHAINALLLKTANKEKVRFVLSGSNLATEAILPYSWAHPSQDLKHLNYIHRNFGSLSLTTMPTISIPDYFYLIFIKGIRQIPFLNYVAYNKEEAKSILSQQFGWRDYGGKHYESVWTRFFQGYYLPVKFGIDKRRAHLSSLICSGQISRDDAVAELENPPYEEALLRDDMKFIIKKFGLTEDQFEEVMKLPPKQAKEYPSHYLFFHKLSYFKNAFRRFATNA